ncbi:MAG: CFI-box-CTERM domain-containing protein, partial [bacterium]
MKKILVFFVISLTSTILFSEDSTYVSDLKCDPGHCNLNREGSVDISFDLPGINNVEEAHFEIEISDKYEKITGSVLSGTELSFSGNVFTLTGKDLESILNGESTANPIVFSDRHFSEDYYNNEENPDTDYISDDEDFVPDEDIYQNDEDYIETTDEEQPDEDVYDPVEEDDETTSLDGEYNLKLVLKMVKDDSDNDNDNDGIDDGSFEDTGDTDNNENDEDDDNSDDSSSIPDTVEKTISFVDDNMPPDTVMEINHEGGNRRIYLTITPPENEEIGTYLIELNGYFEYEGEETEEIIDLLYEKTVPSENHSEKVTVYVDEKDGYRLINNDEGDEKYEYKAYIYAADLAGNSSPETAVEINVSAISTKGFWSSYESAGGSEDGEYCFIATAVYGDYSHRNVIILRNFRDKVLKNIPGGRKLISFYYKNGSSAAIFLEKHPLLKKITGIMLTPITIVSWCFVNPSAGLSLLLLFIFISFLILKSGKSFLILAIFLTLSFSGELKAEENRSLFSGDFTFNNSFFFPGIDKKVDGTPFEDVSGGKPHYLPSLKFGVDLPFLRDYVKITGRTGIGYTRFKGKCLTPDGETSRDKTEFYLIPVTAEIKVRPEYSFPLKPYVTGGLDYIFWWINEHGNLAEDGGTKGIHG